MLLTKIGALSTAATTAADLGASRDLLDAVERAAVALRSRHRLASDASIELILPAWSRGLMRANLTKAQPGDRRTDVTDAEVDVHLRVRHISPIFSVDAQSFGAQTHPQRRFLELLPLVEPLPHGPTDVALDAVSATLGDELGGALGDELALLTVEFCPR